MMTGAPFTLALSGKEAAYLLGAVGLQLQRDDLIARDRDMFVALRDELIQHVEIDPEIAVALGVGVISRTQ